MPRIVSFGNIDPKDLKANPIKALWEAFTSLDRFTKFLLITIALFIVFAAYIINHTLNTRQNAQEATPVTLSWSCKEDKDFINCLSTQFSVSVSAVLDQPNGHPPLYAPVDPDQARIIYQALRIPLSYPKYLNLFKAVAGKSPDQMVDYVIHQNVETGTLGSWAVTSGDGQRVDIYSNLWKVPTSSADYQRYTIVHESGHVIANGTPQKGGVLQAQLYDLVQNLPANSPCIYMVKSSDGRIVRIIKTFPLAPIHDDHEIFAESIADTLVCPDKGPTKCHAGGGGKVGGGDIEDFQHTCAPIYNFVMTNVLGVGSPTSVPPTTPVTITSVPPTSVITVTPTFTPTPTQVPIRISKFVSFVPVADAYVSQSMPNVNFGKDAQLYTDTGPIQLIYYKFDLRSLGGNKNIVNAKLRLRVPQLADAGSDAQQKVRLVKDNNWNETSIKYSNKPSYSKIYATFVAGTQNSYYSVDLTSLVKDYQGKVVSFAIESTANNKLTLNSREANIGKPTLIVQYY